MYFQLDSISWNRLFFYTPRQLQYMSVGRLQVATESGKASIPINWCCQVNCRTISKVSHPPDQ